MELGAVDSSRIGNELATSLVGMTSPTNMTSDIIHIPLQFSHSHKGVQHLGFVFDPQLDKSSVECGLLLSFRTHVRSVRKNGDVGFEDVWICRARKRGGVQEV